MTAAFDSILDQRYSLSEKISFVRDKLKRRPRDSRLQKQAAEHAAKLKAFVRSEEYRSVVQQARGIIAVLPEFLVQFPELDPLFGTNAQGLCVHEYSAFVNEAVSPLQVNLVFVAYFGKLR